MRRAHSVRVGSSFYLAEPVQAEVLHLWAAHDLGRAINPLLAEGQIQGAMAQGLGFTTMEEIILRNGRALNPNFTDYRLATALDMPEILPTLVESYDPFGPFGAKGVGESALVAVAPAIANALYHAVGIRIKELPITPEKFLAMLRGREQNALVTL